MSKTNKLLISYLVVMCALTFVRICFNESYFGELDDISSDRLFSTLAQIVCMGIIPLTAIILTSKKKNFAYISKRIGYKPFGSMKAVWIVIALAILHPVINGGVSTVWSAIIKATGYTSVVSDPEVYADFGAFILGVFFSAILPATFEEITHRCVAFEMTKGGVVKKIVITSLLFAFMHQNILQTGYTFVGGLVFGTVTVITGSIFPAMIMHFVNNLFVCVRVYSDSIGGLVSSVMDWIYGLAYTWWGMAILVILWIGSVALTLYLLKLLYNQNKDNIKLNEKAEVCTKKDKVLGIFLWIAIFVIGIITTLYSYIWGIMR